MVYAVIMAGGFGTRFWPKSRKSKPKQFLSLFGDKTMIQQTVERLNGFIDIDRIMVVTNKDYVEIVEKQMPALDSSLIIGEPVAKNTAPCVASAAAILNKRDPESVMIVLPADHRIGKPEAFKKVLKTAVETAKRENSLVTIGIKPNRAETGYGYIRRESEPETENLSGPVYKVRNFTEKPDLETAGDFLVSEDYFWNSGIFIWKTSTILKAFEEHLSEVYREVEKLQKTECTEEDIRTFYEACPSISIDYGIMEKADNVHVVPGEFDWNDVGSWKAVHELSEKDTNGNAATQSKTLFYKSSGNYVSGEGKKLIAFAGLKNVALIETENAILVVNLEQAQNVKKVVDEIEKDEKTKKYL